MLLQFLSFSVNLLQKDFETILQESASVDNFEIMHRPRSISVCGAIPPKHMKVINFGITLTVYYSMAFINCAYKFCTKFNANYFLKNS